MFRFGGPRASFWWSCHRGISFGEYLLIALMLEDFHARNHILTEDEIYNYHYVDGLSYETICTQNNLDWASINARARLRYGQMQAYAVGQDILFWGWDDMLD